MNVARHPNGKSEMARIFLTSDALTRDPALSDPSLHPYQILLISGGWIFSKI